MATHPEGTIAGFWDRLSTAVGEGTHEAATPIDACELTDPIWSWVGVNYGTTDFGLIQATVANRPTLTADGPGGSPVASFGSDDFMAKIGAHSLAGSGARTITCAFALTSAPASTRECIYELDLNSCFMRKESTAADGQWTTWDDANRINLSTNLNSNTNWYVVTTVSNGASSKTFVNGVADSTGTLAATGALDYANLGKHSNGTGQTAGQYFGGLCIYDAALSDADVLTVQAYYDEHLNLGLGLGASIAGCQGVGTFPMD